MCSEFDLVFNVSTPGGAHWDNVEADAVLDMLPATVSGGARADTPVDHTPASASREEGYARAVAEVRTTLADKIDGTLMS